MGKLTTANLTLRVTMEVGIVTALAAWGHHAGAGPISRLVMTLVAPAVGFGIWGAVDFRRAGRFAEVLRLVEELALSGLAALGWYVAGQPLLAGVLATVSLTYHGLVYVAGDRLLKPRSATA
jgi:hypothetical protein